MVLDFCRKKPLTTPVNIQGLDIERVGTYKYLSVHLNNKLDWSDNTDALYKKRPPYAVETEVLLSVSRTLF